jgi:hypothetical protein
MIKILRAWFAFRFRGGTHGCNGTLKYIKWLEGLKFWEKACHVKETTAEVA